MIDAPTLDTPSAQEIARVHRQWSGTHRRVVPGINRVSLVPSIVQALAPSKCFGLTPHGRRNVISHYRKRNAVRCLVILSVAKNPDRDASLRSA